MTLIISLILILIFASPADARERFFQVQSIDTMKLSRDKARQYLNKADYDKEISIQVKNIAETGATHVALSTPYDEEFVPFLKRWVTIARKHKLKVWFRGNLSGWENWFEYDSVDNSTHMKGIEQFILDNPDLFEDGDIFSTCPECENGNIGDPRMTGDVVGYRNFLIQEYNLAKNAFEKIGKNVAANSFSMNGDVARLIMDESTTKALDGMVTIDHYVSTPEILFLDVKEYIANSKGYISLGEFGAPIPDIHGDMSEKDQAKWIDQALSKLITVPEVRAINYWTNVESSTEIWHGRSPRQAVEVLKKYYYPINISGTIKDIQGQPIKEVTVKSKYKINVFADGHYVFPVLDRESVTFSKYGYVSVVIKADSGKSKDVKRDIIMAKSYPYPIYNFFIQLWDVLKGFIGDLTNR